MVSAKKFLFEYSFDTVDVCADPLGEAGPSSEEAATPCETEVIISAADLANAHAKGFAEGRAEANREFAATIENRVAECLETLGDHLATLLAHRAEAANRAAADATSVAMAVARKIGPHLYNQNSAAKIELAIARILDRIREKARLRIRVSQSLNTELHRRIEPLFERLGFAGQVTVGTDPSLDDGDCRVEWVGGGGELNVSTLMRELDAIAERNLGHIAAIDNVDPNPKEIGKGDDVNAATIAASGNQNASHVRLEPEHG